jgi:hypothetical protein
LSRCRAEFGQNRFYAHRVGLFALEAVPAIDGAKKAGDAKPLQDTAADAHGLVGEHGHGHSGQRVEAFAHTGVQLCVVQLVGGIVADEEFEREAAIFFGGAFAQRARDQTWRPLSDEAVNFLVRKRSAAHFLERSVDRQGQVEL